MWWPGVDVRSGGPGSTRQKEPCVVFDSDLVGPAGRDGTFRRHISFDDRDDVGRMPAGMLIPDLLSHCRRPCTGQSPPGHLRLHADRAAAEVLDTSHYPVGRARSPPVKSPLIRHWLLRIWVVLWLVLVWLLLWGNASFGERAVRPDVGVADHGAAATAQRAGAGSGSPARTAVACGVRDVVAGEVLHAGGLAGDPARSAAGGRGSAREA